MLWHPKGTIVRNIIRDYWEREHLRNGYQLVSTPHIARKELWKISGHLDYYKQNMYLFETDGEGYIVKPMNCPLHAEIYRSKPRSYRELPIKYAEWGTVYRYERSGTLQGLLRVRGFTQDDAHIFCIKEQVQDEVLKLLDMTEHMLQRFGFKRCKAVLSTREPRHTEKYMGSEEDWNNAQRALAKALEKKQIEFHEAPGEAVFYGPKIDVYIVDASGREWQCTTIQFDFNLPERFNMRYVGTDGKEHGIVMIHRALLGSIERFFAILIEHYAGSFPLWLAPIQVRVLPVSEEFTEYAAQIHRYLLAQDIRSELDSTPSTIGYKIRQAELQKIPYMTILGKKEVASGKMSLRKHKQGNLGTIKVQELVNKIKRENI